MTSRSRIIVAACVVFAAVVAASAYQWGGPFQKQFTANRDCCAVPFARNIGLTTRQLRGRAQFYSEVGQDLWLTETVYPGKTSGYFLDVGSGHGTIGSNTKLIESMGWTGICIDPFPKHMEGRTCTMLKEVVFSKAGEKVQFKAAGDLGGIADTLNAWKDKANEAQTVEFTTTTLGEILDREKAPPMIDFMSLDIEGAELDALKGFPFDKYTIGALAVEHNYEEPKRSDIQKLLAAHGMKRVGSIKQDDFYVPSPDSRLGPYEIVAAIGAGGMGEVYRARDPRLGRDVAIKVIPPGFSADPERLQRFEQEARAAAALNHPNILAVFDIGHDAGAPYIVSELLEGETLRERFATAVPLRKAIEYAVQIARGLAAAHAKGIVHRDLKPENIFVTTDGRVKILDFGLAKLTEAAPAAGNVSALPTTPPNTMPGVIMGTIGYMAPEQVRGLAADHRSDLFAFGTILYEALSGQRAFSGQTTMDTMTAILKEDPPDLPVSERRIPPALARIVDRCLEKSPDARFQSAGDLAFALESLSSSSAVDTPIDAGVRETKTITRERIMWAATTILAAIAGYSLFLFTRPHPEPPAALRFEISPPAGTAFLDGLAQPFPAVSPDGRRVAFIVTKGNNAQQLAVHSLDALDSQILPGTEVPFPIQTSMSPFWSPDSRFIGFFAQGKLKKIDVTGGPPQLICDAADGGPGGGTWNREGVILFPLSSGPDTGSVLVRVPASGGTPTPVTTQDATRGFDAWPWFLPDGRHFVYVAQSVTQRSGRGFGPGPINKVNLASLDSPGGTELFSADSKAIYADGHLLFVRDGTLLARPFDATHMKMIGDALPVAEDVASNSLFARAPFSASETGIIAYRTNTRRAFSQLTWFDRSGKEMSRLGEAANLTSVEMSPDGKRVAIMVRASIATPDVWIYDAERGVPTRLTTEGGGLPIWSPDGSRLIFQKDHEGHLNFYQKPSSGVGREELVLSDKGDVYPFSWSPDGHFLLFEKGTNSSPTGDDLWALSLSGESTPKPVLQEPFNQFMGRFSPDGRWIAYVSTESNRNEVYVVPFPGPGDKVRVSADGGTEPRWRRDGKELFYVAPDERLMAAAISSAGPRFEVSGTQSLFTARLPPTQFGRGSRYDVSADGQRFLLIAAVEHAASSTLTIVVNWTAGLKK